MINSHTISTVTLTALAYLFGLNPIYVALIVSAYWAGREVSQAEERFIHRHTPNRKREEMPLLTAYYNPKAWTVKGFWWDMVVPFVASVGLALYLV